MTRRSDVLVIGGGPAGLAAATAAAVPGKLVTVLDDNVSPGGQIWREGLPRTRTQADLGKTRTIEGFERSGAVLLSGRRVIDAPEPGHLRALVEHTQVIENYRFGKLILATGARERFLPFPGWTLPGVFGAGGLQALVKGGYPVRGQRVIVAGTGPVLLAVAAHLREDGAKINAVLEQAPLRRLLPFGAKLFTHVGKLVQGARYRFALRGVRYGIGCWPVAAEGSDKLQRVRLTDGKRTWTEDCDLLACGFHLVPNTELGALLGCRFEEDNIWVDRDQRTSLPDVYCAGEPTGIAGADAALVQGRIAGLAAVRKLAEAAALYSRRDRESAFGRALNRAFALRPELSSLPDADTIVCRCEDVRYRQLQNQSSWTDAKLQTRCGMGPCQGRICGPAVQTLFGWRNTSVRPPLFPIPLWAFCADSATDIHEDTDLQVATTQETV